MQHAPSPSAANALGRQSHPTAASLFALLVIVCLAGALRVTMFEGVYAEFPERIISPDTVRYENPAIGLLHNGTMRDSLPVNETQDVHIAPAYPLFIYSIYRVLGQDHQLLVYAQIVLSLISIVLLYFVALSIWNRASALAAAVLFAAAPMQSLYSSILLSESLFVFSVLLISLFAVRLLKQYSIAPSLKFAVLLGLALGFSALVRPISYYLVFVFLIALLVFHLTLRQHSFARYVQTAFAIFIAFVVVVAPWQIRNKSITGEYMFTDNPGQIMLYWKAAGMLAYRDGLDPPEVRAQIKQRMPTEFSSIAEKHALEKQEGLAIIKSDIPAYLQFSLSGLKKILIGPGLKKFGIFFDGENAGQVSSEQASTGLLGGVEGKTGYASWYLFVIAYSVVYLLLIYALFFMGSVHYWRRGEHRIVLIFCVALAAYFVLASTGHSAADSRMRLPAMPLLVFFAGIGLSRLLSSRKR